MPLAFWGLVGLFLAVLINRAADCWFAPAPLQCGLTRHPARRAAVLVGVPVLLMFMAHSHPEASGLWAMGLFTAVLVLLAVLDWEQRRIPNGIVLPVLALAWVYAGRSGFLLSAVAGAAVAFMCFAALYALGRRMYGPAALGAGDVKLAGLIGAIVGLAGVPYALALGVFVAGIGAAGLMLTGRAGRGDTLPYGACLAAAAVVFLAVAT
jgi:leader peptidase (prepilin peptidase)/N-methyltransferase